MALEEDERAAAAVNAGLALFDAATYSRAVLARLDFRCAPLVFAHLERLPETALLLLTHHLIYDGYSLNRARRALRATWIGSQRTCTR